MFILFIRGVTLEGAGNGVKAFFKPEVCVIIVFMNIQSTDCSSHSVGGKICHAFIVTLVMPS